MTAEDPSSPEAATDSADADEKNEDEDDGIIYPSALSVPVCYPGNIADRTDTILTFFLRCICRLGGYCGPWR